MANSTIFGTNRDDRLWGTSGDACHGHHHGQGRHQQSCQYSHVAVSCAPAKGKVSRYAVLESTQRHFRPHGSRNTRSAAARQGVPVSRPERVGTGIP